MPLRSDLAVDLPKPYPSQAESSTPTLSLETFTQAGEGALQTLQPHEAQDRISPTENAATFDRASQGDSGRVSAIDGQVIEQLQAEKTFLATVVEAGRIETAKSEEELGEINAEVGALRAEVDQLRTQFQQQQQQAIKLRARVTEAAVERATLLAEIRACKALFDAQQGENAFLLREEAMIDGTRDALNDYSSSMQRGGRSGGPDLSSHHSTADANVSSTADQGSERQFIPELPQDDDAKVETSPEPVMPARTPPPPPPKSSLMAVSNPVEDPFAEVVGKEDSDSVHIDPQAQTGGQPLKNSTQAQETEEKDQNGFDAFPPVAGGFDSDPFAINGFGGNSTGEVVAEDPFSATDADFTNATVAAGDGFDAFPPSTGAQFDAFGQNL